MVSPNEIAGYLALFVFCGFAFLFANLLLGRFLRPDLPNVEKLEVYECGEPAIGSSFVQFDLRFYVVALLFIIFDVEVAFFFPWATVFGKSTQLMDPHLAKITASSTSAPALTESVSNLYRELGVTQPTVPTLGPQAAEDLEAKLGRPATRDEQAARAVELDARNLALLSLVDIATFFAVLLVGFAYVWRRGDLDWVRAVSKERSAQPGIVVEEEPLAA